jgi:hypothetical protein
VRSCVSYKARETTNQKNMKKPNITPGPWEVTDSYTALLHNDLREETVWEVNGREAGNSPAYATSEEHAYAIAALPDLLAALEGVLIEVDITDHGENYVELSRHQLKRIKTALTKAGYTF